MEKELEILRLQQQLKLQQADSLTRDILVREYARLIGEAGALQQQISKKEEEVVNENKKQNGEMGPGPIGIDPDNGSGVVGNGRD